MVLGQGAESYLAAAKIASYHRLSRLYTNDKKKSRAFYVNGSDFGHPYLFSDIYDSSAVNFPLSPDRADTLSKILVGTSPEDVIYPLITMYLSKNW